jgi:uncharacterized membrane protein
MIHLTNGIGLVFEVGFALFCFVDVLVAREAAVRVLPRWGWAVAILVFPVGGAAGYLVAGRTWRAAERARPAQDAVPVVGAAGPDVPPADDAALLFALREVNEEHEAMLRRWEDDLRAREERLRAAADRLGLPDPRIGGTAAA